MLLGCSSRVAPERSPARASFLAEVEVPQAPIVKPTPERDFVLHGLANAETRFERLASVEYATPNELFFVRTHGATPRIDAGRWQLVVEGDGVARRMRFDYEELLRLPSRSVTCFLECAGNGRSFYRSLLGREVKGEPWRLGAFGVAEWTGVPLRELLDRAGVSDRAVDVMPIGLDAAEMRRPLPLAKALEDDTLVAYLMNGEPLPPDHGFPARLVVPGWVGAASIKWVGKIRVSEQPLRVRANTEDYVLIGPSWAPTEHALGPPLTTQVPKSAVALPWPAELRAGTQRVVGWAWSPFGRIERVDISLDGGRTFRAAQLIGPNEPRAGTRWELTFLAEPGRMTITPRARDATGQVQPAVTEQPWNDKGYLFGALVPHPVRVWR